METHELVRRLYLRRRREILLLRATDATVAYNTRRKAKAANLPEATQEQTNEERDYALLRQVIRQHHIHLTGPRVVRLWGIGYAWESEWCCLLLPPCIVWRP